MTKRQEKGKVGSAAQYITRAKALKRLQLSLAEFRRLCILKGVYPRVPTTKKEGADKTYYHLRDIRFLAEDPLRQHLYDEETSKKRQSKLVGRGSISAARRVGSKKAVDMSHLIRERYPTFAAALMDLDDCLSTLALLSTVQCDKDSRLSAEVVAEASRLYEEFVAYVCASGRLTRVFASIKGFYLQATLPTGAKATWLHPHRFTTATPADVDLKVLFTFGEWYRTLLKFVNFKLFAEQGWAYPVRRVTEGGDRRVGALSQMLKVSEDTRTLQIFNKMVVFVSREVPFLPVFACLRSAGAEVRWAGDSKDSSAESVGITHVIVDRPLTSITLLEDREYVQPQWVLDCVNEAMLLSVKEYAPGAQLPPHLSPFSDSASEYLPQRRQFLDELKAVNARKAAAVKADVVDTAQAEASLLAGINAEAGGETRKTRVADKAVDQEERERAVMLLSKKHKRLLDKIDSGKKTKRAVADKLRSRASAKTTSK